MENTITELNALLDETMKIVADEQSSTEDGFCLYNSYHVAHAFNLVSARDYIESIKWDLKHNNTLSTYRGLLNYTSEQLFDALTDPAVTSHFLEDNFDYLLSDLETVLDNNTY